MSSSSETASSEEEEVDYRVWSQKRSSAESSWAKSAQEVAVVRPASRKSSTVVKKASASKGKKVDAPKTQPTPPRRTSSVTSRDSEKGNNKEKQQPPAAGRSNSKPRGAEKHPPGKEKEVEPVLITTLPEKKEKEATSQHAKTEDPQLQPRRVLTRQLRDSPYDNPNDDPIVIAAMEAERKQKEIEAHFVGLVREKPSGDGNTFQQSLRGSQSQQTRKPVEAPTPYVPPSKKDYIEDDDFVLPPKSAPLDDLIIQFDNAPAHPPPQVTDEPPTEPPPSSAQPMTINEEQALYLKNLREIRMDAVELMEPSHYFPVVESMEWRDKQEDGQNSRFTQACRVAEMVLKHKSFSEVNDRFFSDHCAQFAIDDQEHSHKEYEIYSQYVALIEKVLLQKLESKVEGFDSDEFFDMLLERQTELDAGAWEILLSAQDFETFGELMRQKHRQRRDSSSEGKVRVGRVESLKTMVRKASPPPQQTPTPAPPPPSTSTTAKSTMSAGSKSVGTKTILKK